MPDNIRQYSSSKVPADLAAWLKAASFEIGIPHLPSAANWGRPGAQPVGKRREPSSAHRLPLEDRKTRQRGPQFAAGANEPRALRGLWKVEEEKDRSETFIVTWLSRMLVSCHNGIQKIISSKRHSGNEPNDSDAPKWDSRGGIVFVCDRCGRIMGVKHFEHQPDSDGLTRCWRDFSASHRCYGGEFLGLPPDREVDQSSR